MKRTSYDANRNTLLEETFANDDAPVVHRSHGIDVPDLSQYALQATYPQAVLSGVGGLIGTSVSLGLLLRGWRWEASLALWILSLGFCAWWWWKQYNANVSASWDMITDRWETETERIRKHALAEGVKLGNPDAAAREAVGLPGYTDAEREAFKVCAVFERLLDGGRIVRGAEKIHVWHTGDEIDTLEHMRLLEKLKRLGLASGGNGKTWRSRYQWPDKDSAFEALTLALEGQPFNPPVPPQGNTP